MTAAILSIGTELTRGEIVNTNAAWLSAELTAAGFTVDVIDAIPDDVDQIVAALRTLAQTRRLVVVTGGLGPTTDDLTAAAAAKAAGVSLVRDESALLAIRRRVESRGKTMNAGHEKQADLPAGADVLSNSVGSAPGFSIPLGDTPLFFLPGVPREMKRMFTDQVLPRIRPSAPNNTFQVRLRTYGLGESLVGQALAGIEGTHAGVTLGYRVHFPEVDVKVHARGANREVARDLAIRASTEVKARLGDVVYGEGDEAFTEMVGRAVRSRGYRLALAESCTGGLIAHMLTRYPASDYLVGGAVVYANSAKTRLLGVSEDTLRWHGAVSAEVAAEMAEGVRRVCETDVGVSVTGIAGPTGGTAEKPVGLVYWAVAHPGGTVVRSKVFQGEREEVQIAAAYAVLDLLRRIALGLPERAQ
ncbi:CinA family nicotinamide mononucleotide deamidase-related protein [Polyangium jinanense]|uniref:CinA-like protein n=1 Tax=Polyangium jinanense TaxID=2829994 RepID=A0A9X3X2D0_9BACT|nr:CinA family nicotinamide mononucleotide deamidase-related protein [Polyangium jinanense]MDC3956318.1 CinA family nicotinamide mononucleotide deamidase-related protein [Polyangium jinanense]MDC3982454.1 CinA family nicotinamide mononucleotide deamidase-related protein [Polyangium jinanense]